MKTPESHAAPAAPAEAGEPADAIVAVTHADPYRYYATLRAGPALVFDARLGMWLAGGAAAVAALLEHPDCRVRPAQEAVPRALAGTAAGEIFAHLVRMNDGTAHAQPKLALQRALAGVDAARLEARAYALALGLKPHRCLSAWAMAVPVSAVAELLGFAPSALPELAAWTADFVACLSPLSTAAQLENASVAAGELLQRFKELVRATPLDAAGPLGQTRREAAAIGWSNADALLANLVGLLSQTYEATAGLIGNSVVALASRPGLQQILRATIDQPAGAGVSAGVSVIRAMVEEVCRHDSPVQNTRRFLAAPAEVAGIELEAGATVLLVLAAANRDALANPRPDAFLLERCERRLFTFGHGCHACPARALACAITAGAVRALLTALPHLSLDTLAWTYRRSTNVRIPVFEAQPHAAA